MPIGRVKIEKPNGAIGDGIQMAIVDDDDFMTRRPCEVVEKIPDDVLASASASYGLDGFDERVARLLPCGPQ
jgi:hypothetical protein